MVKMREGAWYRRRDGKVVGPCIPDGGGVYRWRVADSDYTDDGSYWWSRKRDNWDLIEEVPEPNEVPSTTSAPIPGFPGDLRDWYAGMALPTAMRDRTLNADGCAGAARAAYRMADAMMARRNKERAE